MRSFLTLLITTIILMPPASAKLFDLDQAANLVQVLDDVYDASLDTNNYFDITEEDNVSPSDYSCVRVTNKEVFNRIMKSFKILKEVYPDEEFAIKEAKQELQMILGASPYYYCSLPLDEGYDDIQYRDLYISMGSGISFIIESSYF